MDRVFQITSYCFLYGFSNDMLNAVAWFACLHILYLIAKYACLSVSKLEIMWAYLSLEFVSILVSQNSVPY